MDQLDESSGPQPIPIAVGEFTTVSYTEVDDVGPTLILSPPSPGLYELRVSVIEHDGPEALVWVRLEDADGVRLASYQPPTNSESRFFQVVDEESVRATMGERHGSGRIMEIGVIYQRIGELLPEPAYPMDRVAGLGEAVSGHYPIAEDSSDYWNDIEIPAAEIDASAIYHAVVTFDHSRSLVEAPAYDIYVTAGNVLYAAAIERSGAVWRIVFAPRDGEPPHVSVRGVPGTSYECVVSALLSEAEAETRFGQDALEPDDGPLGANVEHLHGPAGIGISVGAPHTLVFGEDGEPPEDWILLDPLVAGTHSIGISFNDGVWRAVPTEGFTGEFRTELVESDGATVVDVEYVRFEGFSEFPQTVDPILQWQVDDPAEYWFLRIVTPLEYFTGGWAPDPIPIAYRVQLRAE